MSTYRQVPTIEADAAQLAVIFDIANFEGIEGSHMGCLEEQKVQKLTLVENWRSGKVSWKIRA
jgi:hypothetical protein